MVRLCKFFTNVCSLNSRQLHPHFTSFVQLNYHVEFPFKFRLKVSYLLALVKRYTSIVGHYPLSHFKDPSSTSYVVLVPATSLGTLPLVSLCKIVIFFFFSEFTVTHFSFTFCKNLHFTLSSPTSNREFRK